MTDRKTLAVEFLKHCRGGRRAAVEAMLAPGARHHNPHFAAGMPAILDAMMAAASPSPDRDLVVQRVAADGDCVWVHSRVTLGAGQPDYAVVHILRFEGDRVAEFWDIGQAVPADSPNSDGMF